MAGEDGHFLLNGAFAVLSFYMISGFLMSLTFSQNYHRRENGTGRFFLNRALRIYPPYLVVIVATVLFHYLAREPDPFLGYPPPGRQVDLLPQLGLAASNVGLLGMDVLTFLQKSDIISLPPNARLSSPSWSVACELLFYLTLPWVSSKSWRWLLGLIAVALAMRYMIGRDLPWRYGIDIGRYYLGPATWVFFLLGMLSFRLAERTCSTVGSGAAAYLAVALFCVVLIATGVDRFRNLDSLSAWCYYLSLMAALPLLWNLSKGSVLDDWVGKFSYPIYLVHPLLIEIQDYLFGPDLPAISKYALVASCLALGAALLYFAVERPIEFVRAAIRRRRAVERHLTPTADDVPPSLGALAIPAGQMEQAAGGPFPLGS
jgi:peptidoglycan/LPS O-acetylase OafA/YrhL